MAGSAAGSESVGVDAVNLLRLLRCAEQMACAPQLDRERFAAYLAELHALYRRVDLSAGEALSAAHSDDDIDAAVAAFVAVGREMGLDVVPEQEVRS